MRRRSEKYVIEGSKYAHWIGLYLSFHLNWVLGPFVHGRLQNPQTSKVTFAHVITPLRRDAALDDLSVNLLVFTFLDSSSWWEREFDLNVYE